MLFDVETNEATHQQQQQIPYTHIHTYIDILTYIFTNTITL